MTIPASDIVQVLPNVLAAGGNSLVLNGLMLTTSWRVPVGTVLSFASPAAVSSYFGPASDEYAKAQKYFAGFDGSTQKPGALYITQFTPTDVAAYLRGAKLTNTPLTTLKAITSGALTISVDGYSRVASSIDLSTATSYSSVASLLQTALNATAVSGASVTGSVAPGTASFTGAIAGDVLTVSAPVTGTIVIGAIISGTGVTSGTQIVQQLSGTAGGVGVYAVSTAQTVTSTTITATYGTLTVSNVASGTISIGQTLGGGTTSAGTIVTALGTGTGQTGTYIVNKTQTVSSGSLTLSSTPLTVSFDSISGALVITSGITGGASSIAFATGSLAATLLLTSATGAVASPGADAVTPGAFMDSVALITQNWASFFLLQDPDGGSGNAQKLAFSAWTNAQNNRYAFLCWDSDVTPTVSNAATSCLGYLIGANGFSYSGTCLIYDPSNTGQAAFAAGYIASLDFEARNGRYTFAFRSQDGLPATVTNQTVAANLIANGYNFYGAYATANDSFIFANPGSISGEFAWLDSFVNQIWMNSQFQIDLMTLLTNIGNIPYNDAGYAMIEAALTDTINQALNYGAIRAGITLSAAQRTAVNNAAGFNIADTLQTRGWFVLVQNATPQTRQARATPPFFFWYTDGQSVQRLVLNSIELM